MDRLTNHRLLGSIGEIPQTKAKADFHAALQSSDQIAEPELISVQQVSGVLLKLTENIGCA